MTANNGYMEGDVILQYLTYLFHDKALKQAAIAHYHSALSLPLQLKYINLRIPEISQLRTEGYVPPEA